MLPPDSFTSFSRKIIPEINNSSGPDVIQFLVFQCPLLFPGQSIKVFIEGQYTPAEISAQDQGKYPEDEEN